MNKNKLANYLILLLVLIVVFSLIRNWYLDSQLAKGTKQTIGIITDINSGTGVRQIASVDYYYLVEGKKYSGSDNGKFNFMKIGDTLLIEYAKEDKSVSKVVDKYYMKKYKHLMSR